MEKYEFPKSPCPRNLDDRVAAFYSFLFTVAGIVLYWFGAAEFLEGSLIGAIVCTVCCPIPTIAGCFFPHKLSRNRKLRSILGGFAILSCITLLVAVCVISARIGRSHEDGEDPIPFWSSWGTTDLSLGLLMIGQGLSSANLQYNILISITRSSFYRFSPPANAV